MSAAAQKSGSPSANLRCVLRLKLHFFVLPGASWGFLGPVPLLFRSMTAALQRFSGESGRADLPKNLSFSGVTCHLGAVTAAGKYRQLAITGPCQRITCRRKRKAEEEIR